MGQKTSVRTVDLVALILCLQRAEGNKQEDIVIASDSLSALMSIRLGSNAG